MKRPSASKHPVTAVTATSSEPAPASKIAKVVTARGAMKRPAAAEDPKGKAAAAVASTAEPLDAVASIAEPVDASGWDLFD